jgi:S1-C subfamily serine protease
VSDRDAYTCPTCQVRGTVRLEAGCSCPSCLAGEAWGRYANTTLVIEKSDIEELWARRQGESATLLRRARATVPLAIALGLTVLAGFAAFALHALRSAAPLASIVADELHDARAATLLGLAAVCFGGVALWRLRRHRQHRSLVFLASYSLVIVGGALAAVPGVLGWIGASGSLGFRHLAMPERSQMVFSTSALDRVVEATAVIIAPDADGDFSGPKIGSGAVIASDSSRAWIVTCSHVAMGYVSPASWRDAATAPPVWVDLADGRSAVGQVRWTAPPPLDVALVEIAIADPPRPVRIASDSEGAAADSAVLFVPNPFRLGWKVHHGKVVKREAHQTPAGTYSLLFTDLPVQPGDSGSGLFDPTGALIGLNTWAGVDPSIPRGISLPAEVMRAMVASIHEQRLGNLATEGGQ